MNSLPVTSLPKHLRTSKVAEQLAKDSNGDIDANKHKGAVDTASVTESWSTNIAKTPEDAEREYDKLSSCYDQLMASKKYQPPEDASRLLAELVNPSASPAVKVLDAGCGTGLIGPKMAEKGFKDITGFDLSTNCLLEAQKKGAYARTLQQNILEPLVFDDNSFDAVVCIGVFSRFEDHQIMKILKEFARVSKVGGTILFSHRVDLLARSNLVEQINSDSSFHLYFTSKAFPYIPEDEHYKNMFVKYFALRVSGSGA